ncbi:MAG TPA: hypothetical protein VGV59_05360 [Pyrinomonadaceae bacterium]|nr:hypothetical protein [Pyrinomonadaceae bacterium]
MSLPISFDDTPYFKNEYRGDLVITRGVIYYFPHTNVARERGERAKLLGPPGLDDVLLDYLVTKVKVLTATTNKPRLRALGLWREGDTSESLQPRLDAYIAEARKEPPRMMQYEYSLPKPMRFARADIKNVSVRGGLRFDTEYDTHEFYIGFTRSKALREALWEGGFLHQSAI